MVMERLVVSPSDVFSQQTGEDLRRLVAQSLMAHGEDLPAPQLAAYLSGWSSALDLVRRTDLTMPSASDELHRAMASVVAALDAAARSVLDEDAV